MTLKRFGVGPRMSAAVVYGGVARLAGFVAEKAAETRRNRRLVADIGKFAAAKLERF